MGILVEDLVAAVEGSVGRPLAVDLELLPSRILSNIRSGGE